jgi:hypothetical protein
MLTMLRAARHEMRNLSNLDDMIWGQKMKFSTNMLCISLRGLLSQLHCTKLRLHIEQQMSYKNVKIGPISTETNINRCKITIFTNLECL